MDDVSNNVEREVSTIPTERVKDPVLSTVSSSIRMGESSNFTSPEIQQSKGLLRYCQELNQLLTNFEGQLLQYNELSDEIDGKSFRICLPFSFLLACFSLGN